MQLYCGLPIITNKITEDETKGVPHHLLGCISLEEETWTVGKFVGEALRTVCLNFIPFDRRLTRLDRRNPKSRQATDLSWWDSLLHTVTLVSGCAIR
jgi:hypothetical protein